MSAVLQHDVFAGLKFLPSAHAYTSLRSSDLHSCGAPVCLHDEHGRARLRTIGRSRPRGHGARRSRRGDPRSGAGAIATLTENGATTVVTAGLGDIAEGTPIPTDLPQHVRVGSVTKTFTAVIVLQLVAGHRIDIDPVDRHVSARSAHR
ncbi:serine hydrolase [Nocardia sp. NPDC005366]|uniref:serine hydrolase n=1 Tax=Nocardia sp. NPDC005366 TaxID=3156878 RepID=UPI0033A2411D